MSSDVLPATAEVPSTLRVKESRKTPDSSSVWKCLRCNKHYSDKYCLQRHNRKCIGHVEIAPGTVNILERNPSNIITSLHSSNGVSTIFCKTGVRNVPSRRSCLICEKSFATKHNLVYHIKCYHPSIDVDSICPPSFPENPSDISSLNSSNKVNTISRKTSVRKANRRHSCSICQKSFANKCDLVYHIKSYHPSLDVDAIFPPADQLSRNALRCPGELLRWLH